jgi:hypothetical protein
MKVVVAKSVVLLQVKSCKYNRITSTESESLCVTAFTEPKDLLPQSHNCIYNVKRRILPPPPLRLQKHTDLCAHNSSILLTYDLRLGSLTLHAPEAGYFIKLILLYQLFRGILFLTVVFKRLRQ